MRKGKGREEGREPGESKNKLGSQVGRGREAGKRREEEGRGDKTVCIMRLPF